MIIYEKTNTALFIFTFWFLRSKTMFIFSVLWGINSYLYSMKCLDLTESFLQNLHLHSNLLLPMYFNILNNSSKTYVMDITKIPLSPITAFYWYFIYPEKLIIISDNIDIIHNNLLSMLRNMTFSWCHESSLHFNNK